MPENKYTIDLSIVLTVEEVIGLLERKDTVWARNRLLLVDALLYRLSYEKFTIKELERLHEHASIHNLPDIENLTNQKLNMAKRR